MKQKLEKAIPAGRNRFLPATKALAKEIQIVDKPTIHSSLKKLSSRLFTGKSKRSDCYHLTAKLELEYNLKEKENWSPKIKGWWNNRHAPSLIRQTHPRGLGDASFTSQSCRKRTICWLCLEMTHGYHWWQCCPIDQATHEWLRRDHVSTIAVMPVPHKGSFWSYGVIAPRRRKDGLTVLKPRWKPAPEDAPRFSYHRSLPLTPEIFDILGIKTWCREMKSS